ncbi:TPA: cystatin E/M-like [Bos taurus]|nr:TPA: cystatin E/M-like [Bos taurus]
MGGHGLAFLRRGPGQGLSPGTDSIHGGPPLPQLVAGIKYYLTVDMGSTACRKSAVAGDHVDLTTCPLAAEAQQEKLRCDFEILVVPWKNSSQLLKHDCVSL